MPSLTRRTVPLLAVALALLTSPVAAQGSAPADPAVAKASVEAVRAELERRLRMRGPRPEAVSVIPGNEAMAKLDSSELVRSALARFGRQVIYGTDDRKDWHEIADPKVKAVAQASVALFNAEEFDVILSGVQSIKLRAFAEAYRLCADERYVEQSIGPFCSGTLIAPNLVLTAGHCVAEVSGSSDTPPASKTRFVFGFRVEQKGGGAPDIAADRQVYTGVRVIGGELEKGRGRDWAIVQLDRDVDPSAGQPVAQIRREPVRKGLGVYVIGYPSGLALKYAPGAEVRDDTNPAYYVANLDTYGGNSGSGVYEAGTNALAGILVRGENDYVEDQQNRCRRSNVCPTTGCRGEDVTNLSIVRFPK